MSETKAEQGWRLLSIDELAVKLLGTYHRIADLEAENARLQERVVQLQQETERLRGYLLLECGHRVLWPDDSPAICTDCLRDVYDERDRYKVLAERRREALKSVEWNGEIAGVATCPSCGAVEGEPHREGCLLWSIISPKGDE